jgi:CHAD domain-containing protein
VSRFADKSLRRLLRDVRSKAEAAGTDALKLHRVRIASKRVRYAAEFFASLYRDRLTDFVRLCKDIQDTLGLLHDAQTQLAYVESLPEAADPAVAAARRRLRRALKRQAWRQYRAYVRLRPGLLSRRGRKRVRGWLGPGNRLKCRPRRKAAAGTEGQPSREG